MFPLRSAWRLDSGAASRRIAAAATLSLISVVLAPAPSRADDVTDKKKAVDQQIVRLNDALEGTTTALANAFLNLTKTQAQLPGARAAVSSAQVALAVALTKEAKAIAFRELVVQQLAVAQATEQRAVAKQKADAASATTTQAQLDAYAADVFQGDGQSQLAVAFGASSPDEFTQRLVVAETVSAAADDTLNNLQTAQADGSATTAYLVAVRKEIVDLKVAAENAVAAALTASAEAKSARSSAVAAQSSLLGLEAAQKAYAATVAAKKADEEKQLTIAQEESAKLKAILVERARLAAIAEAKRRAEEAARRRAAEAARQKAIAEARARAKKTGAPVVLPPPIAEPSPSRGFVLSSPANGPITSGFGMRFHPVLLRWMLHDGIDYGIACGTPVYATAPGAIFKAGFNPRGWGNQILIDHGIQRGVDVVTSYNHLSQIIRFGGWVGRGQLIGYSGTTGFSTGCHLHFGVYVNGTPVNPLNWL